MPPFQPQCFVMVMVKQLWVRALSLLSLALCLLPLRSEAVVVNWDALTWTEAEGVFTKSFETDASNAGNDITVTITGVTSGFAPGNQYPYINNSLTGGLSPVQDGLFLNMNFASENDAIFVTVTFNYSVGASDVSFSIFDIDYTSGGDGSGYADRINLVGINGVGLIVAPSSITRPGGNSTAEDGSGTNIYIHGDASADDDSNDGNATYSFSGTNVIKSFTFRYGNETADSPNNPGNQWINLHDITYTPKIPEWHPGLIASFACMMLVGVRRFFF